MKGCMIRVPYFELLCKYPKRPQRRPLNEIVTTEAVIDGAAIKCELVAAIYKSVTDVVVWNLSMSKPFTATIT